MKTVSLLVIAVFCSITMWSQNNIPMLGNSAPSFEANTTNGKINFPGDFGKSWKILFSHPKDFTPVCTSEILQLAKMQNEFESLGVKIAIISTDDILSHQQWKQSMEDILKENNDTSKIYFPFIDDSNAKISNQYGMLHAWENTTRDVRGVFVIDPENKIRTVSFYPMNLGRNMDEIKRTIIALQISEKSNVLMPANWKYGGDVLMPYLPYSESDLKENPDLKNQFYKVGMNMWYKKGQGN
jgi:peroxiredoxin 2/4